MTEDAALYDALDATWPAAETIYEAGWLLRRGAGGGKRVSAATRLKAEADPTDAIEGLARWGQPPLFQVRGAQPDLDADLAARGLAVIDKTNIYDAPIGALTDDRSELGRIYRCAGPVVFMREIWAAGGVGPDRLAVMDRAAGPKSWLFARVNDQPVGVGFVAVAGDIAMVHAIEVSPEARRQGVGRQIVTGAANFAAEQGAARLALATTLGNDAANRLYAQLGMTIAARYHYRIG